MQSGAVQSAAPWASVMTLLRTSRTASGRAMCFPLPPLDEQRTIAAFLDQETERIDSLIAKKRLLIERLREYRTALITRTVTRGLPPEAARAAGLDPSPGLKPSGVEWLGDVPEHWEVLHPSFGFGRIGSGTTPRSDAEEYYRGDTPWVTTSELRESTIFETAKSVTAAALHDHTALHVYPPGALVIAMYGATIGRLGILGVPAAVNQACCVFADTDPPASEVCLLLARGLSGRSLISHAAGGGQPNLSQEDLRCASDHPAPPPTSNRIAEYLDTEATRCSMVWSEQVETLAIERLQEYRTRRSSRRRSQARSTCGKLLELRQLASNDCFERLRDDPRSQRALLNAIEQRLRERVIHGVGPVVQSALKHGDLGQKSGRDSRRMSLEWGNRALQGERLSNRDCRTSFLPDRAL